MSSGEWDARYASHDDGMWSGRPNGVLVAELAGTSPGRALDVGCGEGADAIWLAGAGWQVTGLDVSEVALERAAAAARTAGVGVEWICADIATAPPATGGYDLVSVHYPALEPSPGDHAIRALLAAVAPGGTLLVVGHAPLDPDHADAHGHAPTDYVQPADVSARLDERWKLEVDETRPRLDPVPEGWSVPGRRGAAREATQLTHLPGAGGLRPEDPGDDRGDVPPRRHGGARVRRSGRHPGRTCRTRMA